MEKEELFSTIKSKVGNTNLSDRSFSTYVDNIMPGEGVEIDDAFIDKHVNILKSLTGQMRSDVSSALSNALPGEVQRYLEKNPQYIEEYMAKKGTKPEPPTDDKYTKLMEELRGLKDSMASQQKQQTISSLKAAATNKLTKTGIEVNSGLWEDAINSVTIADDATADDVFELAKSKYEDMCKKYGFDGGRPFGSKSSGGGAEKQDKAIKDFFDKKKAKMKK